MPINLAGVASPIAQLYPPFIAATKAVEPTGPVGPGDTATYTITYKNTGSSTARNVVITDQIPEGTEYISGSANPSQSAEYYNGSGWSLSEPTIVTHIRWTINEVAAYTGGGTVSFRVKVKE